MPLEVTYLDDTVLEINTTGGHSIQVLTPDNRVEGAFALNDVKSVALVSDTPPPVVAAPVVEEAPEPTPEVEIPAEPEATPEPVEETPVVEEPAPAEPETVPVDPETTDEISTDDPHTTAVFSAITSLDGAIAVAGDVSNDETTVAAHVAQAQTDIAELLTQYPDSLPLQDAKSQIDALAENFAPPAAA